MPLPKTSMTILDVSYDEELLKLRKNFLELQGYAVYSMTNVDEALVRISVQDFDAVLIGHSVPPEARQTFVRAARELCPSLPMVAIVLTPGEREELADESVAGSAGRDALMDTL